MKKLMKKKVNMFGKDVSVFLVALVCVGLVSAALLGFYGVITGMAVVSQSVILEDDPITGEWNTNLVAGKTIIDCDTDDTGHSLRNNADIPAVIQLGTTCKKDTTQDDGTKTITSIDWDGVCEGIDTEIYGILELDNKVGDIDSDNDFCTNTEWDRINDNTIATLLYSIVGNEFGYDLNAEGLIASTDYSLIYYADDWPGNNPGALIATGTSDSNGDLVISGNTDLGMSLPHLDDDNAKDTCDYCTNNCNPADSHCRGAKIWLVPSSDYDETNKKLTAWNQANYLFETDLITYTKTTDNEITLPANGGGFNFCVENDFALNLVPDTYTIETKILPVL